MNCYFRTFSEEGTLSLGRALGRALTPGMTILLSGDLGTGKTVLARGIGDTLGVSRVRSPSFTLVNEYVTRKCTVVHADLYRLEPGETAELGLEDYLDEGGSGKKCLLLVEWPERWATPPEEDVLRVAIEAEDETKRGFLFSSQGERADAALRALRVSLADDPMTEKPL
ncbi:MAG: tRNA (adenosine(37)-N6)-threonylcarbamoyltransferase complex ATPase subunit type 1 TsaE [Synergistaceae bacterium]|jgi:tRNA threonylcarbamoyladenosine biosynthesis protein TsaE|nr:tRNA (adenosine(37)-N6)-threonylcarbamoyltransferase complex ATPase subunit type 1 TsaE [Synergistaceae bacterium]